MSESEPGKSIGDTFAVVKSGSLAEARLTSEDAENLLTENSKLRELLKRVIVEQRDYHLDALVDLQKASQELDEIGKSYD